MESSGLHPALTKTEYLFKRKPLKIFGGAFQVFDSMGSQVLYSKQKAFKLREDFRVYTDEHMNEELLIVKTPQILDNYATYNVHDSITGEHVGSIRRKGLMSIIKDEWVFQSPDGAAIGRLTEASILGALLARFFTLVPQTYAIEDAAGHIVAKIKQCINPFVLKYRLTLTDSSHTFDPR